MKDHENSVSTFRQELIDLINSYSMESDSSTPDHILADYLCDCLDAYEKAIDCRRSWYKGDLEAAND